MTQSEDIETVKRVADSLPKSGSNATPEQLLRPVDNSKCYSGTAGESDSTSITFGGAGTGPWRDPDCIRCHEGTCVGHDVTVVHMGPGGGGRNVGSIEAYQRRLIDPVKTGYSEEEAYRKWETIRDAGMPASTQKDYDAVEPPHYQRGPRIYMDEGVQEGDWYDVQCIDVFREIKDPRLATAFKYIWRVAFGGKAEPWDSRTQQERDSRDIDSARWYLQDYLNNLPGPLADSPAPGYNALQAHQERIRDTYGD